MRRRTMFFVILAASLLLYLSAACISRHLASGTPPSYPTVASAEPPVEVKKCYECHETIAEFHAKGKHAGVNCASCHAALARHLADPSPDTRPFTDLSWEACGGCHQAEYRSFFRTAMHRPARDEKSQLTGRAPNPLWDKLMMGHGFTKEHATTRSHAWMLPDHLLVDRAYGGRFRPRNGWQYLVANPKEKLWNLLEDTHSESSEQKAFIPQSAAAANPVCLQCKTQDRILDWAYLGDPQATATWSRTSSVVELVRSLQRGLNCIFCHDPHAARPRVVRDALIASLTAPEGDTLWHKDPKRTGIKVYELGERGFTRKIALLDSYDSRLLCGQCHVEYNCNPGYDVKTGQPIKMDDPRTNHIPYRDVFEVYQNYVEKIGFLDFKHTLTGGLLWKAQHPESETFYNSKMAAAGVQCDDCHLPRLKDPSTGKEYTSHFAVTPRLQLKETCLRCHATWTENQATYVIDSIRAYHKGKMRKAEFWISGLIDKIVEAKKAGVDPEIIRQAQDQHLRAHILWEWWTAENSDGFHNPQMARESLTRSVDESQKGIKLLTEAMEGPAKK